MNLNVLTAISPVDGRYRSKTEELAKFFSEFGLIKYRVQVEIEYFIAMVEAQVSPLQSFPLDQIQTIRNIYLNFTEEDALWIKNSEKIFVLFRL